MSVREPNNIMTESELVHSVFRNCLRSNLLYLAGATYGRGTDLTHIPTSGPFQLVANSDKAASQLTRRDGKASLGPTPIP